MPFKIVRNDITKMNTEAIVNTANEEPIVGTGCDLAVYNAAGYDELLRYREEKIGDVAEGEVFITPGFNLQAKYIIHAVSPLYIDGEHGEEDKLRACYQKSLALAKENGIQSVAFPLISTGGFGYPKEEGMRIAADEINAFLLSNDMTIYLVVFDTKATLLGEKIYPALEAYIDHNYVKTARQEEYGDAYFNSVRPTDAGYRDYMCQAKELDKRANRRPRTGGERSKPLAGLFSSKSDKCVEEEPVVEAAKEHYCDSICPSCDSEISEDKLGHFWDDEDAVNELNRKLKEKLAHKADSFSEYLLYLIESRGMKNVDVYKRAIVDKRYFAKLKKNRDFHPEKIKALCLCVGARLSLDDTKDLLARAGYALSPADMTDIIFSYFIENNHFDVIDIDICLEEYNLPSIIS